MSARTSNAASPLAGSRRTNSTSLSAPGLPMVRLDGPASDWGKITPPAITTFFPEAGAMVPAPIRYVWSIRTFPVPVADPEVLLTTSALLVVTVSPA